MFCPNNHFVQHGTTKLTLSLFVSWVGTNHPHNAFAPDYLTIFTYTFYGTSYFHFSNLLSYRQVTYIPVMPCQLRRTIRPLFRSYGDISTITVSPGKIRIKCIRIFPETCAKILWPFSSSTLNIAFGKASVTLACSFIVSFFTIDVYFMVKTSQPFSVIAIVCST